MQSSRRYALVGLAGLAMTGAASAQWTPPYWSVSRVGIPDPYQNEVYVNASGRVVGASGINREKPWTWTFGTGTVRLGLMDAEHTGPGNARNANYAWINEAGAIIGTSHRNMGGGTSAWIWTQETGTTRLGLIDAQHTSSNGYRESTTTLMNELGLVLGSSLRYQGDSDAGETAWVWSVLDGLTRLGFIDAAHTRSDGARVSRARGLTNTGMVVGNSIRFNGAQESGQSAWVWSDDEGLTRLGFVDADHTGTDGVQTSSVQPAYRNPGPSGQVIGWSSRYVAGNEGGTSAWVWNRDGGLIRIGLTNAQHTYPNGWQSSAASQQNTAGHVLGYSSSHNQDDLFLSGTSAWIWTSTLGTIRLGLYDSQHTSMTGRQESYAGLSEGGQAFGFSLRYNGDLEAGRTAWVWTADTGPIRLGYTDAPHTKTDGTQYSWVGGLSTSPRVIGFSERYIGNSISGYSAWTWSPLGGLVRLGFTDSQHTSTAGQQGSFAEWINDSGLVVGWSQRWNGSTSAGFTGWVYDSATGITTPLELSTRADGYSFTQPSWLIDSGWVTGNYDLHDGDRFVSRNAFVWSAERGHADIGTLLYGGPTAHGFSNISRIATIAGSNTILAYADDDTLIALTRGCPADFNGDGLIGTDADIEAFFACLAGNCCDTCFTADYNADGDTGTDVDIEAFFRVLGGGNC